MSKTSKSMSKYLISFPSYDEEAIENRQSNLANYQHIRMDRREPLINLLIQSTKLYNDLKAAEAQRLKREAEEKMTAQRAMQKNMSNRRRFSHR